MMRHAPLSIVALVVACGGGASSTPGPEAPGAATERYEVPSGDLAAAIAGPHRSEENRARDRYRHPLETLQLFGVEPTMTVVELSPGGGWYTEILAPYLRGQGRLVAAAPSAEGRRAEYRARFEAKLAEHPELYSEVLVATFDPPAPIDLGADGSADVVLTFRNTHNWINDGGEREAYEAAFRVLRPGGIFGVVQHRANEGADAHETAEKGYVPEAYVIEVARSVGFELVERSEINANPNDTKDYAEGVWALPPALRLGEQDRERYLAIGESDRMTLKFRKPEAPAPSAPPAG
jgi:predicted methyltransferase